MPPAELPPEVHSGFVARFRNYFLTGLIVAGPIAITFYLTWWFVTWVDGLVRPFVPVAYRPETYLPFGLPGSGLIVAVFALTLLGFLTANLIGRTLVDLGERLLGRMPVVRAIYRGLKQVFETLFSGQGSSFRRVGLVEFPSPGMWSIVLISQPPSVEIANSLPGQEEHISVFLPCAPNPTTGFLLLRAEKQDHRSRDERRGCRDPDHVGGVVQPGSDPQKKIAALAGMANAARVANASPAAAGAGKGRVTSTRSMRFEFRPQIDQDCRGSCALFDERSSEGVSPMWPVAVSCKYFSTSSLDTRSSANIR